MYSSMLQNIKHQHNPTTYGGGDFNQSSMTFGNSNARGSMNTNDTANDERELDEIIILPPTPSILEGEFFA